MVRVYGWIALDDQKRHRQAWAVLCASRRVPGLLANVLQAASTAAKNHSQNAALQLNRRAVASMCMAAHPLAPIN